MFVFLYAVKRFNAWSLVLEEASAVLADANREFWGETLAHMLML